MKITNQKSVVATLRLMKTLTINQLKNILI